MFVRGWGAKLLVQYNGNSRELLLTDKQHCRAKRLRTHHITINTPKNKLSFLGYVRATYSNMLLWQPRDILHHYVGDKLCEQITPICCLGNGTQSGDWLRTTIISDMHAPLYSSFVRVP